MDKSVKEKTKKEKTKKGAKAEKNTTAEKTKQAKAGAPRRTSSALRLENLEKGAFLIEFIEPAAPMDMVRRDLPAGLLPPRIQPRTPAWQSSTDNYRVMERKGYRVTTDIGCLIPHPQYSTRQAGSSDKGHQRVFNFFARWKPSAGGSARNQYGWPAELQISHLCHRRECVRPDHIIAEEQWRNLKRNYCGLGGVCDCGNDVKCLRRYQMDDQTNDSVGYAKTKEEVRELLKDAPPFNIAGPEKYVDRDAEAARRQKVNAAARKRKADALALATERNAAKDASSSSEDDEEGSASDEDGSGDA